MALEDERPLLSAVVERSMSCEPASCRAVLCFGRPDYQVTVSLRLA